ncbi:MAG: YihA family ribosome biogenesis GTP-binding protein [Candidatus Protochlamydia sp.]|nr:YihA family ribosome biogenesis GTP-binding protein [Candidatus Protochlamydia sp.]
MKKTVHAHFVKTAVDPKDYPVIRNQSGKILPEIAVVGRSNVGKSSLLNLLFQSKNLVKTSSTPGKTQTLNFFKMNDEIAFADLPGYGYAKVPPSVKKQWGPMVRSYLEQRESLALILFLLDIRRIPNEEDLQFIEWVLFNEKPLILVLTKIDKVNQKEVRGNTAKILETLDLDNLHYIHFSVPKNRGERELMLKIREAVCPT